MQMFDQEEGCAGLDELVTRACSSESLRQMHLCGTGAVAELERKLREHYRAPYALCVSNATTGLLAIGLALEFGHAVDFVTTPLTFGASLAGWLFLGARPIFADIDPETLALDPDAVKKAITHRTKAILAVDIYGIPSDTFGLRKAAEELGLWYIADAAQSLGASRDGCPASGLADALVVSFTSGKTISAGEGGAIVTGNRELYERLVWLTQHPARQSRDLGMCLTNELALNARIHPLAAIWANTAFEDSLERLGRHQTECFRIIDALNAIGLTEPIDFERRGIRPAFFRLTAAWREKPASCELVRELGARGCSANLVPSPFGVMYQQPAFRAQFGRRYRKPYPCRSAEHQASVRFCVSTRASPGMARPGCAAR